jgi:hypothetical protein
VDGGWSVVFGSDVGAAFDPVGVVAGSFDDAGVGAASAGVEFSRISAVVAWSAVTRRSGGKIRLVGDLAADDPKRAGKR